MKKIHKIIGWTSIILFQNGISMESKSNGDTFLEKNNELLVKDLLDNIDQTFKSKIKGFLNIFAMTLENITEDKLNTCFNFGISGMIEYIQNEKNKNIKPSEPLIELYKTFKSIELSLKYEKNGENLIFFIDSNNEFFMYLFTINKKVNDLDSEIYKKFTTMLESYPQHPLLLCIPQDDSIIMLARVKAMKINLDKSIQDINNIINSIKEQLKLLELNGAELIQGLYSEKFERLPEKQQEDILKIAELLQNKKLFQIAQLLIEKLLNKTTLKNSGNMREY